MIASLFLIAAATVAPWEDPAVNSVNRLPARAISIPCETEQLAFDILQLDRPKSDSRWIQSLNGRWDFKWKRSPELAEWERETALMVPGCWQLQGAFDPPLYINTIYPIEKDAPRVMKAPADTNWTATVYRNPVGLYTTKFKRPWRWFFRKTILHFAGVSSAFFVRVNGHAVGYSEDSRLPAEFDLTPYLKWFGENMLEVEVYKHSDGTYFECQDFWRLSGIFREVYLVSEHPRAPYDLVVETQLSDDLKRGKFIVRDENGKVLKERDVPEVRLWSSEEPNLYITPIEHRWGWWIFGGTDYRAVSFGFRKVEVKDGIVYFNGRRLLVKGVNRHEMSPEGGYTITLDGMERDARLMKDYNVNAVRTCHYPDLPEWYDICDREGIMVCCEANVESHGYGYGPESLAHRHEFESTHVERGVNMVKVLRNHPSIVFWSLGNEAGFGDNFRAEYKAMKALDATRPIQYERAHTADEYGFNQDWSAPESEIACPMYLSPAAVEAYVSQNPVKPLIQCEYAHAMGNSGGDVEEYWKLVRKYPSFQGGFVWDFVDQAVWKTDAQGTYLAYGGDFGDEPNDGNFNCNGMFDAERNPHPSAIEIKHAYQSIRSLAFDFATGRLRILNDYQVRTLKGVLCRWTAHDAAGKESASGVFSLGELAPGREQEFVLKDFKGDSVQLRYMHRGVQIAWDGFARPFVAPTVKTTGPLANPGFKLNLWRAPTDNDRGWKMDEVCRIWKTATETQQLPAGVKSELKFLATEDGATLVDWTLTVPKGLPPIPRVGLTCSLPKTETVSWFGLGPDENYSDRATAAMLGKYQATVTKVSGYADARTGRIVYPAVRLNPDNYIEPGEQGYRTGCRQLEVGKFEFVAVNAPFGFNVWPYAQSALEGVRHQWEIRESENLTVNIDAAQMGVGGDDSWGAKPHAQHQLMDGVYRLQFIVRERK